MFWKSCEANNRQAAPAMKSLGKVKEQNNEANLFHCMCLDIGRSDNFVQGICVNNPRISNKLKV